MKSAIRLEELLEPVLGEKSGEMALKINERNAEIADSVHGIALQAINAYWDLYDTESMEADLSHLGFLLVELGNYFRHLSLRPAFAFKMDLKAKYMYYEAVRAFSNARGHEDDAYQLVAELPDLLDYSDTRQIIDGLRSKPDSK